MISEKQIVFRATAEQRLRFSIYVQVSVTSQLWKLGILFRIR
jgi:hypothetical protein